MEESDKNGRWNMTELRANEAARTQFRILPLSRNYQLNELYFDFLLITLRFS